MSFHPPHPQARSRGSALIVTLATISLMATLAFSALRVASGQRRDVRVDLDRDQARALADAGLNFAEHRLRGLMARDPWEPLRAVDAALLDDSGNSQEVRLADRELLRTENRTYGQFSVGVWLEVDGDDRNAFVTATGYFPNAERPRAKQTIQAVIRLSERPGEVFDYGYFVNNWGWLYGDPIFSYGNARSNGQFDAGNYRPGIHGTPRYQHLDDDGSLAGYIDDNDDGVTDGSDGGVYSSWDIVGASRVRGMGGLAKNQHDFLRQVPMPNLNRLHIYEAQAVASGASVSLGGQLDRAGNPTGPLQLMDGVLGDDGGEPENIVLIGTEAEPIVLDGLVVVRGDVIIRGVVTGRGAIVSGRNVYVADDVTYLHGPTTERPPGESQATSEAWLADNLDADFLGLYAKENVVIGDFEQSLWQSYVGSWLADDHNMSREDSGSDKIPNTRAGKDGKSGTNDDDVLEGDGSWTTLRYTDEDAAMGVIPEGFTVGDPVPGTGEDIDGDGEYDRFNIDVGDFALSSPLSSRAEWAGNLPERVEEYSQLSNLHVTRIEGLLYTNHALAMLTIAWDHDLDFYGALVCRNEAIIGGVRSINTIYDRRLLGGSLFPGLLPHTPARLQTLAWRVARGGDVDTLEPRF